MFKMKLKHINQLIDDQIDNYEGKDRDILIKLSNDLFDYRQKRKKKKNKEE